MENVSLFENESTVNNFARVEIFPETNLFCIDCYRFVKEKIYEFSSLPNNWDGYGGIALFSDIADVANSFIITLSSSYLDRITDIFPNPNGTLTLEWEKNESEKISLEIGKDNYSYYVKYENQEPEFIDGQNIIQDIKEFTQRLREFFGENVFFVY